MAMITDSSLLSTPARLRCMMTMAIWSPYAPKSKMCLLRRKAC